MDRRVPTERPTISLFAQEALSETALSSVLHGAEEEGVPILVTKTTSTDTFGMALDAATQSHLDIGIGISGHMAVITTRRLPKSTPYLVTGFGVDAEADRAIGANAARLVKRTPLILKHFISIHDHLRSAQTNLENNV